jgi:NHL repeat
MAAQPGFYVSFSGESATPIGNVYALSASGATVAQQVLGPGPQGPSYEELRGLAFGPDGDLYVCQAKKKDSAVLQFGAPASGGAGGSYQRPFVLAYAAPAASSGLLHPYQPAFGAGGNLYVASQDTNVVTGFFGPLSGSARQAMPLSAFLQKSYPQGIFNPGTIVAAWSAAAGVPPFTPVPVDRGGLTFAASGGSTHSVRGLCFDGAGHLFVADEGNNRIGVYDAASGSFLGAITGSKSHSLASPVALFCAAGGGTVYIGSPGDQRVYTYPVSQVASGDFTASVLIHDDKRLDKLSGLTLDAAGNLYTGSRKSAEIHRWTSPGWSPSSFAGPFSDSPEQILYVPDLLG